VAPGARGRILAAAAPELPPGLPAAWPAAQVGQRLPALVGARPWNRDEIDTLALADLAAARGRLLDSEAEHPLGYPRHAPTRRPFDPAAWHLADMSPRAGWAAVARLTQPA
jgi:hypothetical protein